jgi:hypothetical protein
MRAPKISSWSLLRSLFVPAFAMIACLLASSTPTLGQTDSGTAQADTIKQLMDRLTAAEAKIQQLESQSATQHAPAVTPPPTLEPAPVVPPPAATPPPSGAPPPEAAPPPADVSASDSAAHDHMMEIPGGPVLHIRGFFDLDFDKGIAAQNLQYPEGATSNSTFRAGEFDLFMTSQLSDNLSFLSEFVASSGEQNVFGIDVERFQLTYRPSKYFEISAGRFHTDFGYYNTAFHHGTWFSTATGRPFMYYFEDSGGVLPIHELGITTTGYIPSGKMDLHWTAEVGNGSSEFGSPLYGDGVENFAADRNRKDVNFAIYSKPQWLPGLQIGGSFLNGELLPYGTALKVSQDVSSAYVVFINPKWEFMNEAVLLRHHITSLGQTYNSPLGYTQIAYHVGKYRPYFRFQEVNINNNDIASQFTGRYEGPSAGVRADFFDYACIKLQYNRIYLRNAAPQNGAELQLAFTF